MSSAEIPRHWAETDGGEERVGGSAPTRLEVEAGEVRARANGCGRLRKLLSDGAWHSALELVDVGGLRYGGRLHEIRHGLDGSPALDVEGEPQVRGGRPVWRYRARPVAPWQARLL